MGSIIKYFIIVQYVFLSVKGVSQNDTLDYKNLTWSNGLQMLNGELYTGTCKQSYPNGKTQFICTFKLGKLHGLFTNYFEDETMQVSKPFSNGEIDGQWLEWDRNGNKFSERNYKKGKPHGKTVFWNAEGDPTLISYYVNGLKEGEETSWYDKSQKYAHTNYKNGLKSGKQMAWYQNGQLRYEVNWKEDKRIDTAVAWTELGGLFQKEIYKNGLKLKRLDFNFDGTYLEVLGADNYLEPGELEVIHSKRIITYEGPLSMEHIYIELIIDGKDVKLSHLVDGYEEVDIGSKQQGYTGIQYYQLNGDVTQGKSIVISNFTKYRNDNKNNVTLTKSSNHLKQDYLLNGQIEIHYSVDGKEKVLIVELEETTDLSLLYGN